MSSNSKQIKESNVMKSFSIEYEDIGMVRGRTQYISKGINVDWVETTENTPIQRSGGAGSNIITDCIFGSALQGDGITSIKADGKTQIYMNKKTLINKANFSNVINVTVCTPGNRKIEVDLKIGSDQIGNVREILKEKFDNMDEAIFYRKDEDGDMIERLDSSELCDGEMIYMEFKKKITNRNPIEN